MDDKFTWIPISGYHLFSELPSLRELVYYSDIILLGEVRNLSPVKAKRIVSVKQKTITTEWDAIGVELHSVGCYKGQKYVQDGKISFKVLVDSFLLPIKKNQIIFIFLHKSVLWEDEVLFVSGRVDGIFNVSMKERGDNEITIFVENCAFLWEEGKPIWQNDEELKMLEEVVAQFPYKNGRRPIMSYLKDGYIGDDGLLPIEPFVAALKMFISIQKKKEILDFWKNQNLKEIKPKDIVIPSDKK